MDLTSITVAEACGMVPVLDPATVRFAGFHDGAQDIDTHRLLEDFARIVRASGGQVLTHHPVTAIRLSGGRWHVGAGASEFSSDLLINAAGAWADEVAGMAGVTPLDIVSHRRSMARIPAPDGEEVARWPLFFGVSESWYARPDAGYLLVSPADEDPVSPHDAWAEDLTLAQGLALYEEMVRVPVTRLQSSWAGLRSFAPDRTLVLGRDPQQPTFVWCAGQGGYGFQTAPAASKLLADLVMGRPPELAPETVTQLSPARLR
jgi:glycine/D-amino acid oxidase-like deaminating enzyme